MSNNEDPVTLYTALLRGINVGGKNPIKMTELVKAFQTLGFTNVSTYIQSGNVIFGTHDTDQDRLTACIEEGLSKTFSYQSTVVLRSQEELKAVVTNAPDGYGTQPDTYRYDVIFLKKPLSAAEAIRDLAQREGVDQAFAGDGVLYTIRLNSRATQSRLNRIVEMPIYPTITIRNWNTTTKLLNLIENTGLSGQ
jgi:uncharacterized protein (DUF1697 family)